MNIIKSLDSDFLYTNPLIERFTKCTKVDRADITDNYKHLDLSKSLQFYYNINYEPYRFSYYILNRISSTLIYKELFSYLPDSMFGDIEEIENSNTSLDVFFCFIEEKGKLIFYYLPLLVRVT